MRSVYITSSGSASMGVLRMFDTGKKMYNLASWSFYPADTRHHFVYKMKTSIRRQWCRIDILHWNNIVCLLGRSLGSNSARQHTRQQMWWRLYIFIKSFFYKNVLFRLHPAAFFAIFLLQPPVMFLTHLYKSVMCRFTKRCYKIVIKINSSAKKFVEVTKGIERLQQNALRFSNPNSEQV